MSSANNSRNRQGSCEAEMLYSTGEAIEGGSSRGGGNAAASNSMVLVGVGGVGVVEHVVLDEVESSIGVDAAIEVGDRCR
jgi:hypothetical protein